MGGEAAGGILDLGVVGGGGWKMEGGIKSGR
jgi:hypothetical protein